MQFQDKRGATSLMMRKNMNKMLLKEVDTAGNPAAWYFCPYCQKRLFKGHIKTLRMTCPNCNRLIESKGAPLLGAE